MALILIGEPIWYAQWETTEYIEYPAICRAAPSTDHGTLNLSWFDVEVESQANNVKNIEDSSLGSTESYWRRRYSKIDFSELRGNLETVRVEKGDIVLYRIWNATTKWLGGKFAVVVATLGSPTDPHPRINLRYVNDSGVSTLAPAVDPIEGYASEDDAEGNNLWSNIPNIE